MLEYESSDVSEGIEINKASDSRECIIYCYYCFLEIKFRFQLKVYIDYHELIQKVIIFNDVAIVTVKQNYYKFYFWYINKSEAINLLNIGVLDKKVEHGSNFSL